MRTFQLRPIGVAATHFCMEERFSGVIFALVKGTMPDFGPIFEKYASDLKQAAELHDAQVDAQVMERGR